MRVDAGSAKAEAAARNSQSRRVNCGNLNGKRVFLPKDYIKATSMFRILHGDVSRGANRGDSGCADAAAGSAGTSTKNGCDSRRLHVSRDCADRHPQRRWVGERDEERRVRGVLRPRASHPAAAETGWRGVERTGSGEGRRTRPEGTGGLREEAEAD